jgi:hypothetical protein
MKAKRMPSDKQEAKNSVLEHTDSALPQRAAQGQPRDVDEQVRHLLKHIYNASPEHRVGELLAIRDYAIAHTDNAHEFEQIVDEAQAKGWLICGTKATISLGRILRWSGKCGQNRVLSFERHERQPCTYQTSAL